MSFLEEFEDLLIDSVIVNRLVTGPRDPNTGAADLTLEALWNGIGRLRPYSRKLSDGVAITGAGVPLAIPSFELHTPPWPIPDVAVEVLNIRVNGLEYPLLKPPLYNRDPELEHIKFLLAEPLPSPRVA